MSHSPQPPEDALVPAPEPDWDSEPTDYDPSKGDHRPTDHSGGAPARHGDLVENAVVDATDDPEDDK